MRYLNVFVLVVLLVQWSIVLAAAVIRYNFILGVFLGHTLFALLHLIWRGLKWGWQQAAGLLRKAHDRFGRPK